MSDDAGVITDKWQFDLRRGLWLIEQSGHIFIAPVVGEKEPRRAVPGDAFINDVPEGKSGRFHSTIRLPTPVEGEKRIDVDQTNESFVLDDTWIVKWNVTVGSPQSLDKERHLTDCAFLHTPKSLGHITWTSDSTAEHLLASAYQYLPGAVDGWTWCVAHAMANEVDSWPEAIGEVVSGMHNAFAGTDLAHGDLHVGQLLLYQDTYYVIDFDGDPISPGPESWLGDVVSMLCSFIHVAAVAELKYGASHSLAQWIEVVTHRFLDIYQHHRPRITLPPRRQMLELMAERELREFDYAKRFLPEWIYAAEYGQAFVERMMSESG